MIFLFAIFLVPVLVGVGGVIYIVVSDYKNEKFNTRQYVHDFIFDGITADYIDD